MSSWSKVKLVVLFWSVTSYMLFSNPDCIIVGWGGKMGGKGEREGEREGGRDGLGDTCLFCSVSFWRERMILCVSKQITCQVRRDYSGAKCPLGFGLMTCLCAPKCDEGKIAVKCGDIITVTRWQTLVLVVVEFVTVYTPGRGIGGEYCLGCHGDRFLTS